MKKYEILPHPAELRLRIYGKTLEELFINAAFALAETLRRDAEKISKTPNLKAKSYKLKTKSTDINSLLVDFLNEILAKSQINKSIYLVSNVNCQMSDAKAELKATLVGFPVERFDEDIKAVTYEDLDIKQINPPNGEWQTIVVFDI